MNSHAKVGSKACGGVRSSGEDREWRVLLVRGDIDQPFGGVVSVDGCIRELTAPEANMLKEPADGDQ